ncbi:uncharacterized protein LOC121242276 [Juglans microcarpa x Juglans regia]|uniref:uncharacterized protein LOC121242276 n=1 Tax=Juglans microcarpa x Juglans regia TaxID=2249226 RepID=UPI001B7DA5E8|nr:uncharacterized protein LOC121242276 [Juglans microcarpa x Juglans regia]
MGIGVVIRDSAGDIQVVLATQRNFVTSAYLAERYALLRAVNLCTDLGFENVEFEGDAKAVVDAVNATASDSSWSGQIIEDIRQAKLLHSRWKFSFIRREGNQSAHQTAQLALSLDIETVWMEEGPVAVLPYI